MAGGVQGEAALLDYQAAVFDVEEAGVLGDGPGLSRAVAQVRAQRPPGQPWPVALAAGGYERDPAPMTITGMESPDQYARQMRFCQLPVPRPRQGAPSRFAND